MKTLKLLIVAILAGTSFGSMAQESEKNTEFLSKKLGLYVFPAENQSAEQQEKDEYESYKWAVEQSGVDPLDLPQIEVEKVETGPDGGAVRGAAGGAAVLNRRIHFPLVVIRIHLAKQRSTLVILTIIMLGHHPSDRS